MQIPVNQYEKELIDDSIETRKKFITGFYKKCLLISFNEHTSKLNVNLNDYLHSIIMSKLKLVIP